MRATPAAALAALLLAALPAAAEDVSDPATGLTIALPQGFRATRTQRPGQDVVFGLDPNAPRRCVGGNAHMCEAAFARAPQDPGLSQAQINSLSATPERLAALRGTLERGLRIGSLELVTWGAATGTEMIGTPVAGPDAAEARVMLTMAETPRGRVVLACVAHRNETPAIFEVFRTLRQTVRAPG